MRTTFTTRRTFIKTMGIAGIGSALPLFLQKCFDHEEYRVSDPPNILWITCEDIGPTLGCYGDQFAHTPNIDQLAEKSLVYENAFASAPICAPARSTLISGIYSTSLGTQHLRSQIPVPGSLQILPEYMDEYGYYTTNNSKTDYNFDPSGRWDENGPDAHWRNRPRHTAFFSVFNFGITHEGHANSSDESDLEQLALRHDPENLPLPPYYPDTPEMRNIWARQYDLISVMDKQVGALLNQLEEDGLTDNTIIFFFSDHGVGLPRYKRWMYNSGIHVPLIIHIPAKYRPMTRSFPHEQRDELVSFVDFAPTVLNLCDIRVPGTMEGRVFLGPERSKKRKYINAARSRADDIYDVSRAIRSDRFIYIRNYMPHRPYIRKAIIFSDRKRSFEELWRVKSLGQLPDPAEDMFEPKPSEELYDLKRDPHELNNLIDSPEHQQILNQMQDALHDWILDTRDTGFLHEAEMMIRSQGSNPYEMAHDPSLYNLPEILRAAEMVGDKSIPVRELDRKLQDSDSGVRFWIAQALLARFHEAREILPSIINALNDDSPSVQNVAAEILCRLDQCNEALPILASNLQDTERPWVVLDTASTLREIGPKASPLIPEMQSVLKQNSGDVWDRYQNWYYPMFIGLALDQALLNCGEQLPTL